MGQGLYNMLGYGCLNPTFILGEDDCIDLPDALRDLGLQSMNETEDEYLVIPLAVDDRLRQQEDKVPPLPDHVLRCAPRRAQYADPSLKFDVPAKIKKNWKKAQAFYRKNKLVLPDARLVIINDWD
jgi:hypothetical protein